MKSKTSVNYLKQRLCELTKDPQYLPERLKNIYQYVLIHKSATTREIAEQFPRNPKYPRKTNIAKCGGELKALLDFGFLEREKINLDSNTAYGYEYVYTVNSKIVWFNPNPPHEVVCPKCNHKILLKS